MEPLVNILSQLIFIFFDLEYEKEIFLKTRRDLLATAYNIQATKSNFEIRNEIVLAIKKFENEIFSNSLISYICILNLLKYAKETNTDEKINKMHEVQRFNILVGSEDHKKDAKHLMTLSELIGNAEEVKKQNFKLITSRDSGIKYIIDNDNHLWLLKEFGTTKKMLDDVKCISNINRLLVGIDTKGKFWKCSEYQFKKEYVKELMEYTFDRMYDLPENEYLLITNEEIALRVNIYGFSEVKVKNFEVQVNKIVQVGFNNKSTFFVGDMGDVYNKYRMKIKSNIISAHVCPTIIIFIDNLGKAHRSEHDAIHFVELQIPDKIKDVAFIPAGPVFLSESGNVYCQFNKHSDPIIVATDVEKINEIFEGVLLINKEETKLLRYSLALDIEKHDFNYGNIDLS